MDKKDAELFTDMLNTPAPTALRVHQNLEAQLREFMAINEVQRLVLAMAVIHGGRGSSMWKIPFSARERIPEGFRLDIQEDVEGKFIRIRILEPSNLWVPDK